MPDQFIVRCTVSWGGGKGKKVLPNQEVVVLAYGPEMAFYEAEQALKAKILKQMSPAGARNTAHTVKVYDFQDITQRG